MGNFCQSNKKKQQQQVVISNSKRSSQLRQMTPMLSLDSRVTQFYNVHKKAIKTKTLDSENKKSEANLQSPDLQCIEGKSSKIRYARNSLVMQKSKKSFVDGKNSLEAEKNQGKKRDLHSIDLDERQSIQDYCPQIKINADIYQSHNFEEINIDEDYLTLQNSDLVLDYKKNYLNQLGSLQFNLVNDYLKFNSQKVDGLTNSFLRFSLSNLVFTEYQYDKLSKRTEKEIIENMLIQNSSSINDFGVLQLLRQCLAKAGIQLMIENCLDSYIQNQQRYTQQLAQIGYQEYQYDVFNMSCLHYLATDVSIEQFEIKINLGISKSINQLSFGQLMAEEQLRTAFCIEWEEIIKEQIIAIISCNKIQAPQVALNSQRDESNNHLIIRREAPYFLEQSGQINDFQIIWTRLQKNQEQQQIGFTQQKDREIISLFFFIPNQDKQFYKDIQLELSKRLKKIRTDFVELNIHNMFNICLACPQFLDKWVLIQFKSSEKIQYNHMDVPEMGGLPYYQPSGWILYGVKKAENRQAQQMAESTTLTWAFAYADLNYVSYNNVRFDLLDDVGCNKEEFKDKKCGHGIILQTKPDDITSNTPIVLNYYRQRCSFLLKLMVTVNSQKVRVPKGYEDRIYIVNDVSQVKVYGLLVKSLKI